MKHHEIQGSASKTQFRPDLSNRSGIKINKRNVGWFTRSDQVISLPLFKPGETLEKSWFNFLWYTRCTSHNWEGSCFPFRWKWTKETRQRKMSNNMIKDYLYVTAILSRWTRIFFQGSYYDINVSRRGSYLVSRNHYARVCVWNVSPTGFRCSNYFFF